MFVAKEDHVYIVMPMCNLIEYRDNYSDISGSLWHFKRNEVPADNADLTINDSRSFKYKAALVWKTTNDNNGKSSVEETKIVVTLKVFE